MNQQKSKTFETVKLNDGALYGLSDGAKMDPKSSIIEYVDNAEDANASKVSIVYEEENRTLTVLSVEETDLEDLDKLFSLGVRGKLHTKKNGVGKYKQGFKYAGPSLIGEDNAGEIKVAVRPISGNNWGATQRIDYTTDGEYTDNKIEITDDSEMPTGYNFMVKVVGCKNIPRKDIINLHVELGIRYREQIKNGSTCIDINGAKILPQDRLYSNQGARVDYHPAVYLEWNGDKKAATWEWSDLRRTQFNDYELIDYDMTLGLNGRKKGTAVSSRSGVEVAIRGVTIIYDGELLNLVGVQPQPSSSGFRGRLNILNLELADAYIKGGNKSCSSVNKSFSENDDTRAIRMRIKEDYNTVMKRYHVEDTKVKRYRSITDVDEYCNKYCINCTFKFSYDDETVEAFVFDKTDNIIIVNLNSRIMASFTNDKAISLFIMALLDTCEKKKAEEIYKSMKKFKNNRENDDIF